ncbi:MAG TPA: YetF domain-containing protein [Acetobacteraceae bacterium]|nr:YetF domain-containing protein [Acetobacteraceae bacterium]
MQNSPWKQIFFGNAPPLFLVEVIFRAVVMYAALLLTLRLLGKRMNGQLSVTELAVMISLGAIVSVPMELPKQGLLPGLFLLFLILLFQRTLGYLSFRSRRVGRVVYGKVSTLVEAGVLQRPAMERDGITKDQLFAHLRYHRISQLGELDRVYLEANGMFSVFRSSVPRPGLSTLPEKDDADIAAQEHKKGMLVCCFCGTPMKERPTGMGECPNCRRSEWTQAIGD